jgi:hypothetical protein
MEEHAHDLISIGLLSDTTFSGLQRSCPHQGSVCFIGSNNGGVLSTKKNGWIKKGTVIIIGESKFTVGTSEHQNHEGYIKIDKNTVVRKNDNVMKQNTLILPMWYYIEDKGKIVLPANTIIYPLYTNCKMILQDETTVIVY